ncbi:hypothetical protein HRW18_12235 [Streptomyces lunaelactis]|uniref:hypothetical protein n=1 Tax=Streptomyces lunaelactis TaxID=1535768 RepID=UPI0015853349|nr:hypothetical protein [Streptomyces lunaelactis]NUK08767.1 hypothetical protein [Streptomyces lunaelactis]NUK55802.1 hypothetical protein [Streptomyces lunaelactis]NUL09761.1 hypothetical protein [Streptomyces lunaelactis]NUL22276.1 hypothetical protein [Streptomyces lunaelactis]
MRLNRITPSVLSIGIAAILMAVAGLANSATVDTRRTSVTASPPCELAKSLSSTTVRELGASQTAAGAKPAVTIGCGADSSDGVGALAVAADDVVISFETDGLDHAIMQKVIDESGANDALLSDVIKGNFETYPLSVPGFEGE